MRRPLGLTIIGFIQTILGSILFLLSIFLFTFTYLSTQYGDILREVMGEMNMPYILMIHINLILLGLSIILMVTGIAILMGSKWVYYIEVILVISLLLNMIFLSIDNVTNVILTIFPILALIYLNSRGVREYFGQIGYEESDSYIKF